MDRGSYKFVPFFAIKAGPAACSGIVGDTQPQDHGIW
jgi:hypothetical protein